MEKSPILNNPYEEPQAHYATDERGQLDYDRPARGRRIFAPTVAAIPIKQGPQTAAFEVNDFRQDYDSELVNLMRREVGAWRGEPYRDVTRVSLELLNFWFRHPERHLPLFFAQREAIETAIWLNEVAAKSNVGQHILSRIAEAQRRVSDEPEQHLPRIAFKMATGTGKTVVMAALMLYHYFNRQKYRHDTHFAGRMSHAGEVSSRRIARRRLLRPLGRR